MSYIHTPKPKNLTMSFIPNHYNKAVQVKIDLIYTFINNLNYLYKKSNKITYYLDDNRCYFTLSFKKSSFFDKFEIEFFKNGLYFLSSNDKIFNENNLVEEYIKNYKEKEYNFNVNILFGNVNILF
jgi:F0F1-type ATP synthase delta subunit